MPALLLWLLSSLWGVSWGVSFFGTIDPNLRGGYFFGGCVVFLIVTWGTAMCVSDGEGDAVIKPAVFALITVIAVLAILHWRGVVSVPTWLSISVGVLLLLIVAVVVATVMSAVSTERKRVLGKRRYR